MGEGEKRGAVKGGWWVGGDEQHMVGAQNEKRTMTNGHPVARYQRQTKRLRDGLGRSRVSAG